MIGFVVAGSGNLGINLRNVSSMSLKMGERHVPVSRVEGFERALIKCGTKPGAHCILY